MMASEIGVMPKNVLVLFFPLEGKKCLSSITAHLFLLGVGANFLE